jgi:hypothetical protein
MLRNELSAVWQHLRRLDPGNPHIYGNMTTVLAQQYNNNPAATTNILPPLQQQQQQQQTPTQPQQWAPPPPTAMQGVEFAGPRPYDHPHR